MLAHGLHTVLPSENAGLAARIVTSGGCLVSDYPPGTSAMRNTFIERDRLQSGLSDGVVVVETGPHGGTMHTVAAARAQLRPLACLVHPQDKRDHPKANGNLEMLREGASPLRNRNDLDSFMHTVRNRQHTQALRPE